MVNYAQHSVVNVLSDFLPAPFLGVFRSHFVQIIVTSTSASQGASNGIASGTSEHGGDMGGAILNIQAEVDYCNHTGSIPGQINEWQ